MNTYTHRHVNTTENTTRNLCSPGCVGISWWANINNICTTKRFSLLLVRAPCHEHKWHRNEVIYVSICYEDQLDDDNQSNESARAAGVECLFGPCYGFRFGSIWLRFIDGDREIRLLVVFTCNVWLLVTPFLIWYKQWRLEWSVEISKTIFDSFFPFIIKNHLYL